MKLLQSIIPGAFSIFIFLILSLNRSWGLVLIGQADSPFNDTRVVTSAADCIGLDLFWRFGDSLDGCRPFGDFNYPISWPIIFHLLGATEDVNFQVGLLLGILFGLSISVLTYLSLDRSSNWIKVSIATFAGVSPPALLALERGNVDLVIFSLISLSIFLVLSNRTFLSSGVLSIAAVLKIYPLGGLLMLTWSNRRWKFQVLLFTAIFVSLGLLVLFSDLALILKQTPQIAGMSFGAGVVPLALSNFAELQLPPIFIKFSGITIFIIVFSISLWIMQKRFKNKFGIALSRTAESINSDIVAANLILSGGGVFLFAYIFGSSFDYRLIFLIPVLLGFSRVRTNNSNFGLIPIIIILVIFTGSWAAIGNIAYLIDLGMAFIAPIFASLLFRVLSLRRIQLLGN